MEPNNTPEEQKVFSRNEMWRFVNLLVDHRNDDVSTLFTERGIDGQLTNFPKAKHFIDKINSLKND